MKARKSKPADTPRISKSWRLKKEAIDAVTRGAIHYEMGESELLEKAIAGYTLYVPKATPRKSKK